MDDSGADVLLTASRRERLHDSSIRDHRQMYSSNYSFRNGKSP